MTVGALDGVRVIELGEGVSAAYCARLFADLGADVLKVESPGTGDCTRQWGPFPDDQPHPERSGTFFFLNTNKRSVVLDLERATDRERLCALARDADLLIENLRPPRLRDLGLDHAALSRSNPDLVTISITPFGQTGPRAEWKGFDLNAFHLSAAGNRYCGRPEQEPLKHGSFSADFYGATVGAAWGLAALYGRGRVGGGQHVDVSSAEAIAATVVGAMAIGSFAQDGAYDRRTGVGMPMAAPATLLPAKDGYVWIIALEPGQWAGLKRALGSPDWMSVDLFDDAFVRGQNADLIYSMLAEWTRTRTKAEIMETCQREGCPATAVLSVAEAVAHEHIVARDFLVSLEHPALGRTRALGGAFRLSRTTNGPTRPAPLLGEHGDRVLDGGPVWQHADRFGEAGSARRDDARASAPPPGAAAPLEGVRVANFGWVWAGPVVGQTLGLLGAEVYKLESRERLDFMRTLPPFVDGIPGPDRCLSLHACWAGNRSATVNLKHEAGRALARRIVRACDVVVENFGPGVMQSLGLDFERLHRDQPDLVMCSLPAAGLSGPLKDIRTYGLSLTSLTGLDSVTGYPGGPPIPFEAPYSDPYTGILAAFAVVAALTHRDRTGEGQHVELSQQEAVLQMMGPAFMDAELNQRTTGPLGNRHPLGAMAPHGVYPCRGEDRWISLAVEDDAAWGALRGAMGDPDWARDPALAARAGRLAGAEHVDRRIADWTRTHDASALAASLQQAGVAAAPVLGVPDLLEDPHFRARETFQRAPRADGGSSMIYGAYVKTSRTRPEIRIGPDLGQHNDDLFRGVLGLSDAEYASLVEERVIY